MSGQMNCVMVWVTSEEGCSFGVVSDDGVRNDIVEALDTQHDVRLHNFTERQTLSVCVA